MNVVLLYHTKQIVKRNIMNLLTLIRVNLGMYPAVTCLLVIIGCVLLITYLPLIISNVTTLIKRIVSRVHNPDSHKTMRYLPTRRIKVSWDKKIIETPGKRITKISKELRLFPLIGEKKQASSTRPSDELRRSGKQLTNVESIRELLNKERRYYWDLLQDDRLVEINRFEGKEFEKLYEAVESLKESYKEIQQCLIEKRAYESRRLKHHDEQTRLSDSDTLYQKKPFIEDLSAIENRSKFANKLYAQMQGKYKQRLESFWLESERMSGSKVSEKEKNERSRIHWVETYASIEESLSMMMLIDLSRREVSYSNDLEARPIEEKVIETKMQHADPFIVQSASGHCTSMIIDQKRSTIYLCNPYDHPNNSSTLGEVCELLGIDRLRYKIVECYHEASSRNMSKLSEIAMFIEMGLEMRFQDDSAEVQDILFVNTIKNRSCTALTR